MSFDLRVVQTRDLPDRFCPPSRQSSGKRSKSSSWPDPKKNAEDRPSSADGDRVGALIGEFPPPLRNLLKEATGELTKKEREAFLFRVASTQKSSLQDSSFAKEEWRAVLVRWLKEQANRFMAAAAQAQASTPQTPEGSRH